MEVRFNLLPEDLTAFKRFVDAEPAEDASSRKGFWTFWGLLTVGFTGMMFTETGRLIGQYAAAFLSGATVPIILLFLEQRKVRRNAQAKEKWVTAPANQWLFRPQRFLVGTDGLQIIGEQDHTTYRWPIVWKIATTKDHIFFFTTTHSGSVVPRRAFASDAQFDEFVTFAKRCQESKQAAELFAKMGLKRPPSPGGIWDPTSSY